MAEAAVCLRAHVIDNINSGVDGKRRSQGLRDDNKGVDGGRGIYDKSDRLETIMESAGD